MPLNEANAYNSLADHPTMVNEAMPLYSTEYHRNGTVLKQFQNCLPLIFFFCILLF